MVATVILEKMLTVVGLRQPRVVWLNQHLQMETTRARPDSGFERVYSSRRVCWIDRVAARSERLVEAWMMTMTSVVDCFYETCRKPFETSCKETSLEAG